MTDMKKLIRATLIDKNVLFFTTGGVAAAIYATSNVRTALLCAVTVLAAVTAASVAASFASRLTGRLGVMLVYISISSGIMASASALFSNADPASADTLSRTRLLASVSGIVLSCAPKQDEPVLFSSVRASLTAFMYALWLVVLAGLRCALCLAFPFAASPSVTLMLIGFVVASVNYAFVLIAERKERTDNVAEAENDES